MNKLIVNKFMLARPRLDLTCKCQYRIVVSVRLRFRNFSIMSDRGSLRCRCVTIVSNMK